MPRELIVPAIFMTSAFVFYTMGVWAERAQQDLRLWHVALFWLGIVCDTLGTSMMERLVLSGADRPDLVHILTGGAALLLMVVHAVWATWVLLRGSREARARFHRFSIVVWAIWLLPYLGGMIAGIARGTRG